MEPPCPAVFSALLAGDVRCLHSFSPGDLRPFLPCLARVVLCHPTAAALQWQNNRKIIHVTLSGVREVNAIKEYLSVDYRELRQDALREQQLLRKLGPGAGEERGQGSTSGGGGGNAGSILASSLQYGLAIEFERSDHTRRFRLFLSEILRVMNQVCSVLTWCFDCQRCHTDWVFMCFHRLGVRSSWSSRTCLSVRYTWRKSVTSCALQQLVGLLTFLLRTCSRELYFCHSSLPPSLPHPRKELPSLLPVRQLSEALLRLEKGPHLLCKLLANNSDCFDQGIYLIAITQRPL